MSLSRGSKPSFYLFLIFTLLSAAACDPSGSPVLYIDPGVNPGDDLWSYANGSWVPDSSREVQTINQQISVDFIDSMQAKVGRITDDDTVFLKLKQFYKAFTSQVRDTLNTGLRQELKLLDQFDSKDDLPALMVLSAARGYRSPVSVDFYPVSRTEFRAVCKPGRIQFNPDLNLDSYYFVRLPELMSEILPLIELTWEEERIIRVADLQKELNAVLMQAGDLCSDIGEMTQPDWLREYIRLLNVPVSEVCSKSTLDQLTGIIDRYDWEVWKDYFTWVWVEENLLFSNDELMKIFSPNISAFSDFDSWSYYRSPLRAIYMMFKLFPDLMNRLYDFDQERIMAIEAMAEAVKAGLMENIRNHADSAIRDILISRIAPIRFQIVNPAMADTYDTLAISPDDPIKNYRSIMSYRFARNKWFVQHPEQYQEYWQVESADDVPSYRNSTQYVIIPIPYATPPHFSLSFDDAYNYGGLGFYVGHEMAHALDFNFNVEFWKENGQSRLDLFDQYYPYRTREGIPMNSWISVNENFCDIVGLNAALTAYRKLSSSRRETGGHTGLQRFFLAFANSQRDYRSRKHQEENMRNLIYAYSYLRVNGTVRNIDGFYEAFDVQPVDSLYLPPDERIRFW